MQYATLAVVHSSAVQEHNKQIQSRQLSDQQSVSTKALCREQRLVREDGLRHVARRALCRKKFEEEPEEDDDDFEDEGEDGAKSTRPPPTPPAPERKPKGGLDDDKHTLAKLVSAFATEGLICCCSQLWAPARDNDPERLAELLKLDPWTVDEPGQAGQGYTNALQVACAGGYIECVKLLLDHGAIFRDADWQTPPRPFVCTSMLTGTGYFDRKK